ncbi:phasin family protein [Alterisphingorhabdus coralli]|uniref:Phasin family protein n=1 Tax=Alterisphingorhabdus coralli TaxID=3071408 RepID=A0AA97F6X0_9SPHN|nr:phasin family protein [Parasphingorhabdus sp. SCSIO 66989]WOE75073.1 phasin family protein [Parasphingorhabdus sp. SCSIO 66989]
MTKKTETKATAENMTARAQELFGDVSGRAKAAFEKGSEYVSQATEFNKANIEALVESGKIAAKGMQEMGQAYASDTRKNFEDVTATMKDFAAVKSPTEFFQLQAETLRKTFDTAVSQTSKNTEMFVKLAGDAFQPISNRVSVAVENVKKAA